MGGVQAVTRGDGRSREYSRFIGRINMAVVRREPVFRLVAVARVADSQRSILVKDFWAVFLA